MKLNFTPTRGFWVLLASFCVIAAFNPVLAWPPKAGFASAVPTRIQPYLMTSQDEEVSLARSAAPPSVSSGATVMTLGTRGYITAVKGRNGFVCLVERSWANATDAKSAQFWNPKFRAPYCFNAAGARSVLPRYLSRTKWVLAGASQSEIGQRVDAAWTAGKFEEPALGAMCYMMSKRGLLNYGGPWRPHLMFFFSRSSEEPNWGANRPGSPVFVRARTHTVTYMVLVPIWSDGTRAPNDQ